MVRYIKERHLQAPEDGRRIICDEPLKKLFSVEEMTFFSLQKLLSPHFEKSTATRGKAPGSKPGISAFHRPYMMSPALQVGKICFREWLPF